jgi:serine/threonine-protein kinase
MDDLSHLAGTRLADRYRLTRLLDRGGFGAVYEAMDDKFPGRHVAVKLGMAVTSERAFSREAILIGQLNHENVVKVHDHGMEKGLPYIVMDMLHGDRLDVLQEKHHGRLPPELLIKFVREIGAALHNLHRKHLVHRDLKPKNIMLVDTGSVDDSGNPWLRFVLLDFGIASKIDAGNSLANRTMDGAGTPEFMSPEQIAGEESTPKTDLYAFGVILYRLLTGRVPFPLEGNSHAAIANVVFQIVNSPPPRFAEVNSNQVADPRIEELVLQCLNKSPLERPESVLAARNRLLEILDPQIAPQGALGDTDRFREMSQQVGVSNSGIRTWDKAGKVLPRRSLAPLMAGLAVVFLGLGLVGAIFLMRGSIPATPVSFAVTVPAQLTITAGQTRLLPVTITKASDAAVQLSSVDLPASLTLPESLETKETFVEWPLGVDLNANPGTREVVLLARQGQEERTCRIEVDVQPPEVWLPNANSFPVRGDGPILAVDGKNYYQKLIYEVPLERPIRFLLIDTRHMTRAQQPFYMMENKVWNSLYEKFEKETGIPGNRESTLADNGGDWERLPAFGMIANDALRFADWLGGKDMKLPTVVQWWTAAGYFSSKRPSQFSEGPFTIAAGETMAAPPEHAIPVGTSTVDQSPFGIRDMAINGLELTSSFFPTNSRATYPIEDRLLDLYLVGNSPGYERLNYQQAQEYFVANPNVDSCKAGDALPDCGFRLVLETSSPE